MKCHMHTLFNLDLIKVLPQTFLKNKYLKKKKVREISKLFMMS